MLNETTKKKSGALRALVTLLVCAMLPLAAPSSAEAEEYVLKFQSVAPDRTPWARQLKRLKKRWEEKSEGRLKVKLFLGRGNEIALVRKCKAGELQAVGVSTAKSAFPVPRTHRCRSWPPPCWPGSRSRWAICPTCRT